MRRLSASPSRAGRARPLRIPTRPFCRGEARLALGPCSEALAYLGVNFDGRGKNLPAERHRALVIGQGLQEEIDCLTDVGESLLDRLPLRLASLQLRTPGVASVLVPLDYDADLARHQPAFYRPLSRQVAFRPGNQWIGQPGAGATSNRGAL